MRPTRSVLASCEPYPHSAQPCRPSPRVSITGRADVTASSFTGDQLFVATAGLTSLEAEVPLQAETLCGPRRLSGLGGSTITADGFGSILPSHDHEDPP